MVPFNFPFEAIKRLNRVLLVGLFFVRGPLGVFYSCSSLLSLRVHKFNYFYEPVSHFTFACAT